MTSAPILDTAALARLGDQLGDPGMLCGFLHRYLGLLEQRIARIERALRTGDHDDWLDAVLSLKTSSSMAGATALAQEAAALQAETLPCPSREDAYRRAVARRARRVSSLRGVATETARRLRALLTPGAAGAAGAAGVAGG